MFALKINASASSLSARGQETRFPKGGILPIKRETACFWWVTCPLSGEEKRVSKTSHAAHFGGVFVAFCYDLEFRPCPIAEQVAPLGEQAWRDAGGQVADSRFTRVAWESVWAFPDGSSFVEEIPLGG